MANKIKVTRFNSVNAPDSGTGRRVMLIGAAFVLILVGFLLGRTLTPTKNTVTTIKKTSTIGETKTGYGPFDTKGLVPAKFEHSTQGAVAAASSYIGFTPKFYLMTDSAFSRAITDVSSREYRETLFDGMSKNRIVSQSTFTADPNAFFREIPLGYTVASESSDAVTVNVWSETMLVAEPNFNGNTNSTLHTMKLIWEKGDWKIDTWTNQPGPTPRWQSDTDPLTVDDFITAIQPYTGGYDYAPSF